MNCNTQMFCSYSCEEEIFFCDNVNDEQNYLTLSCKKMLEFHIIQPPLVVSPIILEIILMLAKALTQNNEAILVLFPCIVHKLMSPITLGIWSLPRLQLDCQGFSFPRLNGVHGNVAKQGWRTTVSYFGHLLSLCVIFYLWRCPLFFRLVLTDYLFKRSLNIKGLFP